MRREDPGAGGLPGPRQQLNLTAGDEKFLKIFRAREGWVWEYMWERVLLQHNEAGLDGGLTVCEEEKKLQKSG